MLLQHADVQPTNKHEACRIKDPIGFFFTKGHIQNLTKLVRLLEDDDVIIPYIRTSYAVPSIAEKDKVPLFFSLNHTSTKVNLVIFSEDGGVKIEIYDRRNLVGLFTRHMFEEIIVYAHPDDVEMQQFAENCNTMNSVALHAHTHDKEDYRVFSFTQQTSLT